MIIERIDTIMSLKKFIPYWYDNENTKEDAPIMASNEAEARDRAYQRYGGTPPYPMLFLKEVPN